MQKPLLALSIAFLYVSSLLAQETALKKKPAGTLAGNVLEDLSGKGFLFSSVVLVNKNDSIAKRTMLAGKNGAFLFENLPFGIYRIEISYTGYSSLTIDSIQLRSDKTDLDLGDLTLHKSFHQLNEVVVYAEKPLIENKDGKIAYNVSQSPLSSGSNASELLKNMPVINTNPDGTILLRGKTPLILIDEKPTNLTSQQLTDLLESLPANVIEKVEIMINPPPEYATYEGGVINIVTRKGRVGIYSKLAVSGGTQGEGSVSANISYRKVGLNINANAGYGTGEVRGNSYSRRENFYTDSVDYLYTNAWYVNKYKRPNFRFQTDYDFSKRSSLSIVYQGNLNYFNNFSSTFYQNLDSLKNIYNASNRTNSNSGNGYSNGINASYQWKGINPIEKLQIMSGINYGKNNTYKDFYQLFLQYNFLPTGIDSTQTQFTDNYTTSYYLNANYNKPLNVKATLIFTTGTSFSGYDYHNVLNTSYLRKSDSTFIGNALLSNDFLFHQDIFTLRAGFIMTLPFQWKLITGAQIENTRTEFKFIKGNASDAGNSYSRLLPNITLRKDLDKRMNIALIFRETIRRPGITELNPSIDYSDPYNMRFGNPYLTPSLTDNYDINFGYIHGIFNLNASLGYNKVKNVFNSVRTLIEINKTQTTYQNISDQNEYQASFWSGITLSKKVRINISGGYNYNQYNLLEKQLYNYRDGGTFYTTFNYSYSPDKLTVIEGNNVYNSYANPQGKGHSNISMTLGAQRKFLDKKLTVSFTAIDPFGLQEYNGYTSGSNFIIESHSANNSRNFRLSLSYQLSRVLIKSSLSDQQKKDAINAIKK